MKLRILLLVCTLSTIFYAQLQKDWEVKLDIYTSSNEEVLSEIDTDGNIILVGANNEVIVQKFAPDGNLLWTKSPELGLQPGSEPKVIGLYLDGMDNVFIGATYKTDPFGSNRYFSLIEYNSSGEPVLNKKIDYEPIAGWNAIGETKKMHREVPGNFLLAGANYQNTWYVRVDMMGSVMLTETDTLDVQAPFGAYEEHRTYLSRASGDIYCGYHMEGADAQSQFHYGFGMCKFGNDGKVIWQKTLYDFELNETECWLTDGLAASDGQMYFNLFVSHTTATPDNPRYTSRIFKVDSEGELLWEVINASENGSELEARFNHIRFDTGGNILTTGTHEGHLLIAKLSAAGETTWIREDTTLISGLKVIGDNYDGITASWDENTNLRIRRYSPSGDFTTQFYISGATIWQPYYAFNFALGSDRDIYFPHKRTDGIYLLKLYDESTSMTDDEMVCTFGLSQNYPNPFNPETSISYSLVAETKVELKVYDLLGIEIAELVNGVQIPGEYKIKFDATNLSSGVYFYVLSTPNSVLSRKMILLK